MAWTIRTPEEYEATLVRIRHLQDRLRRLASRGGNLAPDVLALSQEIDDYIVSIQRYWDEEERAGEAI
jgi:hypothetical protein